MKSLKLITITVITLFSLSSAVCNAGEVKKLKNNKYSEIKIEKSASGKSTDVKFIVNIADGIKYNWDGPWKLKLNGEKISKKLGTSDFDKSINGYKVSVPSGSGELKYRLTAFICTKDKKRCFREVHKATIKV